MKKKWLVPFVITAILILFIAYGASSADDEKPGFDKYLGQGKYTGEYWPTDDWRTCRPEEAGMDSTKLLQAIEYAASPGFNTDGLVIIRKGHIVGEAYFGNFKSNSKHTSHSMAKSFTSALIGIALDKGLIKSIDEKICQFYDQWDCTDEDDLRSRISIRHVMTLTTGLDWKEDWSPGYTGRNNTLEMARESNYLDYMLEREGLHKPGTRFIYSTGDPMLLSGVIQKATGFTALEYAKKNLFSKIGTPGITWGHDPAGNTITAWGIEATARDYAKFGYLFLNKGRWEDKQIVSEEWVEKSTKTDPSVAMWRAYGYLWHVNLPYRLRWSGSSEPRGTIPRDGYMAEGVLGQNIFIIPSKDLVIVRVANQTKGGMDLVKFLTMVLSAIES